MTISEQTFVNAFNRAIDATKDRVFWVRDQCSKTHSIQSYLYAELENQLNHVIKSEEDKIQLVAEFHKMDAAYIKRSALETAARKNAYPLFGSYFADIVVENENNWKSIEHELGNLSTNKISLLVIITYCETAKYVQELVSNYVESDQKTKTRLLLIIKETEQPKMPERYTKEWGYYKYNGKGWDTLNPTKMAY